jgi:hypothetical protein
MDGLKVGAPHATILGHYTRHLHSPFTVADRPSLPQVSSGSYVPVVKRIGYETVDAFAGKPAVIGPKTRANQLCGTVHPPDLPDHSLKQLPYLANC